MPAPSQDRLTEQGKKLIDQYNRRKRRNLTCLPDAGPPTEFTQVLLDFLREFKDVLSGPLGLDLRLVNLTSKKAQVDQTGPMER